MRKGRYLVAAATLIVAIYGFPPASIEAQTLLYSQDFEDLELGPVVQEAEPFGGLDYEPDQVWTNTPPEGWSRTVDPDMPGLDDDSAGVVEFEGWTFVNAVWWTETAGDQNRSMFSFDNGLDKGVRYLCG